MSKYYLYITFLIFISFQSICFSDDFDFGEENAEYFDTEPVKEPLGFNFPARGKLGIELARQTDVNSRWIKLGPAFNGIVDWYHNYGTIYSEFTVRRNQAFRLEEDSKETISKYENELVLRELYYKKSFSSYTVTLGQNITVWGKSDFLSVLDVVSPIDQTEFIFAKPEDARLGQVMLKIDFWAGNNNISSLISPFPLMNRNPEKQHPYALFGEDFEGGKPESTEGGFMWNYEMSQASIALIAGRFHYRNPLLETDSKLDKKNIKYKVFNILGLTFARTITPVLIKFEAGRYQNMPYQLFSETDQFDITEVHTTVMSLGLDYNNDKYGSFTTEINYYHPDKINNDVKIKSLFALSWFKSFLRERLTINITHIGFKTLLNQLTRFGVIYKMSDRFEFNSQYTYINIKSNDLEYKAFEAFDRFDIGINYNFDLSEG